MRQATVSDCIDVKVDSDIVIIDDELNGSVTLHRDDMLSLITLFVQEGGLADVSESGDGQSDQPSWAVTPSASGNHRTDSGPR